MEHNIQEWWDELMSLAMDNYGSGVCRIIQKSRTYYLDYYYSDVSPQDALEEEWG